MCSFTARRKHTLKVFENGLPGEYLGFREKK
jgi:hypothetical protein